MTTTDVLGNEKPVTHYYGDGSYDCPHCTYAIRADEGLGPCKNPWCIANPQMPVESARKLVAQWDTRRLSLVMSCTRESASLGGFKTMEYPIGSKVKMTRDLDATDSDTLGYPWVLIPKGSIGTVTGPSMPFVNHAGCFQKVRFPEGHVAIVSHNVKQA